MVNLISISKAHETKPNILELTDFCKGLAIIGIFLYHFDSKLLVFGWQGVHVFFVLSGFGLAYSCLRQQEKLESDKINWRKWYVKRAQRILPTYWLVCLATGTVLLFQIALNGSNLLKDSAKVIAQTALDITLLRNLTWVTIFNYNGPLWFVSLIVALYLIFPLLYGLVSRDRSLKRIMLVLLGVALIEFIYRAISLYWLDGFPIGYINFAQICPAPIHPIDRIPNSAFFPFQKEMPFGILPSRITEFTLGVIGAVLFFSNRERFNKTLLNYSGLLAGCVIWFIGSTLPCTGLIGWLPSDFIIALGLTLLLVNLGWLVKRQSFFGFNHLFTRISQLGVLSFYPFLIHEFLILRVFPVTEMQKSPTFWVGSHWFSALLLELVVLGAVIVVTTFLSWLLMRFDKSKLPEILIQRTVEKWLKV
ncbi:acyltransferase family protein [Leptothermofonsia sp. ETS-13]|uniref:acyltransferase family protein n=1 Tax=Leptothermofonsia sp. ETS-13 TaxID=3035696 RepID=UPI003B9DDC00